MVIKRWIVNSTRTILRLHSILHIFEGVAAISEGAYITFSIIAVTGLAQVLAAHLLPDEHIHIGMGVRSTVHTHKKKHTH